MACWFLLATALDPTVFLPYGVAAVTLVGVATSVLTQLLEAAAKVKFALHQAFDAQLTSKLTKAKEAGKQAEKEVGKEAGKEDQGGSGAQPASDEKGEGGGARKGEAGEDYLGDDDDEEEEGDAIGSRSIDVTTSPEEIFDSLGQGRNHVNKVQFAQLFTLLDLDLNESQQERLFAICDVDCSGTVSRDEFVKGWDLMVETFLAEGAESAGLGTNQILMLVAYIVLVLSLVIAFILITLAAWTNESNFASVVQSLLIGGAGRSATSARSRGEAEDPERVDAVVKDILGEQKKANEEG